jgi:hypothetical protein
MHRLCRWIMVAALLCAASFGHAQQPLLNQFKPDLRVFPQFFALAQGLDGDLYIGGSDGVLRYDGGRWHWLPLPRPGAVRALSVDDDGRVWVGAADCFGYIERDAGGSEHFVDLAPRFASKLDGRRFADIWRIARFDGEIYFQALQDLFVVTGEGEPAGHWHHEGRFGALGEVDGEFWSQWRGEGLKRRRGDHFEMLPQGERFAAVHVLGLSVLGPGHVLLHDAQGHATVWERGAFRALALTGDGPPRLL